MSLIDEIKHRRAKSAGASANAGLRFATEAAEEGADYYLTRAARDKFPDLPAMSIRPSVEARIDNTVADLVERKKIRPQDAKRVSSILLAQAKPEIRKLEAEAYRREAGERAMAPPTIMGAAGSSALMTAFPWLLSRGSWLWGKRPEKPLTLGESFKFNFLPAFLPFSAGFETAGHLLAPISDPLRKNRERGYWKSVGESFGGSREGLAERGAEARARYGPLGIPLQMFHGIMNPLASLAYLGQQAGRAFEKPDIKAWAQEAAERRRERLEAQP